MTRERTTHPDPRKQNAADKRAARKVSRAAIAEHNAAVHAARSRDAAALEAHIAEWGEDGFETA